MPDYTYTVQQTASLNSTNSWVNLTSTNGVGSLATVTVTDTNQSAMSFYRVVRLPAPVKLNSLLPFPAFPLCFTLPERRVCGCSLRLRKNS